MLKGVNRHIVEINNPRNEYFEKAILYIKQDKLEIPPSEISTEAQDYLASLCFGEKWKSSSKFSRKRSGFAIKLLLGGAAIAGVGAVIASVLLNM